jgi:glycosyltransferase involved in cell wall biosynthesis
MDQDPLVSVIVPTYNRAQAILVAIESILAQSYSRLEVIVVDDGSVDETANAIRGLIARSASGPGKTAEIRYLYQTNKGPSTARNAGIAVARGEWIAFLDSDDYWLPGKIEWQLRTIEKFKKECGACISDARLVDKSGSMDTSAFRLGGKCYKEALGILPNATIDLANSVGGWWTQALIVRSDLAKQIGGFDAGLQFMEDRDFLFRLSLETSYCYVNLPLAVIDRTNTANDPNASVRAWDSFEFRLRAQQYMYEKWLASSKEFPSDVRAAILQQLRRVHSAWANLYLERDQFDLARHAVSTAIGCEFTGTLAVKWLLIRIAPRIAKRFTPAQRGQI